MSLHIRHMFFSFQSKFCSVIHQETCLLAKRCLSSKMTPTGYFDDADLTDTSDVYIEDKLEERLNQPEKLQQTGRRISAAKEAEEKQRKFIKRKIIEKKENALFGHKQPNLLTWAARVQIKYLNKEDPLYWTPDMLAESFPVSKEVIIKILKNSRLPYDDQEVIQHDTRVYRNWLKLKEAQKILASGGPVDPAYRLVAESVKLGLMKNAAGSRSLPVPETRQLFITQTALAERQKPKVKGEFSAILDDYRKDKESLNKNKNLKTIGIEDPEYVPLLEEISKSAAENELPQKSITSTTNSVQTFSDDDIYSDYEIHSDNRNTAPKQALKDGKFHFRVSNVFGSKHKQRKLPAKDKMFSKT